jgi:nicotinate-nucleotide pyrophosphorylase (carboxylating)
MTPLTQTSPASSRPTSRNEQLRKAFFRGDELGIDQPRYRQAVRAFLDELLSSDIREGDLTARALRLSNDRVTARVLAKAPGVAAGIEEFSWLLGREGIEPTAQKRDGDLLGDGDTLLEFSGGRDDLLALERVGLNLLQRMSGIATLTRSYQERVRRRNPEACVVGTRKTPWGLLDKRALHLGGGGTHRLGLWDAILVKNNHLALLANREEEAVPLAIDRAWSSRNGAAFVEVEVRSQESALAAARAFRRHQEAEPNACPCLVMLDHFSPADAARLVEALRRESLLERVLVEVSGNIAENNLEDYADCGADALSIGSLTHSAPVLDLCQRL